MLGTVKTRAESERVWPSLGLNETPNAIHIPFPIEVHAPVSVPPTWLSSTYLAELSLPG